MRIFNWLFGKGINKDIEKWEKRKPLKENAVKETNSADKDDLNEDRVVADNNIDTEEKVKTKIADVKKYDVDLSDLFEGEYVHHRFYITKEMEKQIHKYVIPELIRNGINNTDEFIAFQEENDLDWVDIFDVYGSFEIWDIKLPKKIRIDSISGGFTKIIDIDKDFNSEEGGYLVYPNGRYYDKYTMIWDCWLHHPEDQIAVDLTFDWLENNKWGK